MIFVSRIFTQIRAVWVGDLEQGWITLKVMSLGLILPFICQDFCFGALGDIAKQKFSYSYVEKKTRITSQVA